MAFDIHGNELRPGHCEVHPDVSEPYPCNVCRAEDDAQRDAYAYMQEQYREQEAEYLRAQEAEHEKYLKTKNDLEDSTPRNYREQRSKP